MPFALHHKGSAMCADVRKASEAVFGSAKDKGFVEGSGQKYGGKNVTGCAEHPSVSDPLPGARKDRFYNPVMNGRIGVGRAGQGAAGFNAGINLERSVWGHGSNLGPGFGLGKPLSGYPFLLRVGRV
jgi:hypothetical protein